MIDSLKPLLQSKFDSAKNRFSQIFNRSTSQPKLQRKHYSLVAAIDLICIVLILLTGIQPAVSLISPLVNPTSNNLKPLQSSKSGYEVFGFAPYWTFNKLDNVDFNVLTTLAYFDVPINSDGTMDRSSNGYQTFHSEEATKLFKKAHDHGTRIVLTITNMKNPTIRAIMDDPAAQQRTIDESIAEVKNRGIDGVNIDFEYTGNPGVVYRQQFSKFVKNFTDQMHAQLPGSKVTVSVYASAVKEPKIYDISEIGHSADGIFMMAYDFAVAGSDNAIPTAPLYGHESGKYWYDIATAVDDFLTEMPAEKLILGVPYYGYNYLVSEPTVKATTLPTPSWRGRSMAQTYSIAQNQVTPEMDGIDSYTTGWDEHGQVGWKAYRVTATGTWRMIFVDDERSLSKKYDFAKQKQLAGVGLWALGFDDGKPELWRLLSEKFGLKLADAKVIQKPIN